MEKFSVKKPLTVLVAVIVVLVLGVVSYMRMTPDLLPSIDLPYVLVMTPYPGATPEKVEMTVTKPLEQSMATLEHINTVQSSSSANYSTVILEFTEDVDMDSITVDILQKINMIEGAWDDMVGTHTILKINPNMLPVMVAAINVEDMDTVALSEFTQNTLLPELEGTSGVASITADGLLEETVVVTLDAEKIDALNQMLREQIDKKLNEGQTELDNAKNELESGKTEIENGKTALEQGKTEFNEQTSDAQQQLDSKQAELSDAKLQLTTQIASLKQQLTSLETTQQQLTTLNDSLSKLLSGKADLEAELATLEELAKTLADLVEQQVTFEGMIAQIQLDPNLTDDQKTAAIDELKVSEEYVAMEAGFVALDANLTARGMTRAELAGEVLRVSAAVKAADVGLEALDKALEELGMNRDMLASSLGEIESGKQQLTAAITMLEKTLADLTAGQTQLAAAQAELEKQKTAAIFELSEATTQLLLGESKLTAAQAQIDEGIAAVEEGRKTAYDSADMSEILSMETVASLLMAQNFSMPAGYAPSDGVDVLVSVGDEVASLEELQHLVLLDLNMEGVDAVTLSDVATVALEDNRNEVYARLNGKDGVLMSFSKQSAYATAEVSENLLARFDELTEEYEGLTFSPLMDQGDYIFMMVDSIMENLLLSALFSVVILFLFLKDLRPTLITLCSIPLSVLFAIILMYFSGVTLNMISLSALAVSIGMLVDNSVVVLENIYRLRNKGVDPLRAAVSGAKQVAGAIVASTLTTICVFLPIVFVEGLTRQLFTDMALTFGYALGASLIVALTLVPAMASRLLKNADERPHRIMDAFLGGYRRLVTVALRKKALVLIVTVVVLVASTALALSKGFIFMPEMNSTQLSVSVETEKGSSADETKAVTDEAMARIQEIEGVQTVGAMLSGSLLGGSSGSNTATMYVLLDEKYLKQSGEIAEKINEVCADLDGEVAASGSGMDSMMGMLGGSGVTLNVYGDDLDVLQATVQDVATILRGVDGLVNVSDGLEESDLEWHFTVDKEKAAKKGLTVAQVYAEVASALTVETTATTLVENGKTFDVKVAKGDTLTAEEIVDHTFTVTGKDGTETEVKLSDVATVEKARAPRAINRDDQRRYMTVTAEVEDGGNVTLATADAKAALEDFTLPDGVTIEFSGENETIMEAVEQLLLMLLLGILLVYLIMVAQFQSLKSPLIVMFTIPLAFTGGFLGLLLTGNEISVISLIGFVMLCGIIVNNGIVLVDYINQLRAEGMSKHDALIEAGVTRMRPILMTSLTTILGLLISALGLGSGNEMMQPIAIVCIGGMIYATLMTLFVVPVMYDIFNRKETLTVVSDEQLTDVEE